MPWVPMTPCDPVEVLVHWLVLGEVGQRWGDDAVPFEAVLAQSKMDAYNIYLWERTIPTLCVHVIFWAPMIVCR